MTADERLRAEAEKAAGLIVHSAVLPSFRQSANIIIAVAQAHAVEVTLSRRDLNDKIAQAEIECARLNRENEALTKYGDEQRQRAKDAERQLEEAQRSPSGRVVHELSKQLAERDAEIARLRGEVRSVANQLRSVSGLHPSWPDRLILLLKEAAGGSNAQPCERIEPETLAVDDGDIGKPDCEPPTHQVWCRKHAPKPAEPERKPLLCPAIKTLRDTIVELDKLHARCQVVDKALGGWTRPCSGPTCEVCKRATSLKNEYDALVRRRLHLLEIAGVKDRCTEGEAT